MNCWQELEEQLATLNAKIDELRPNAIVNPDYWLDSTTSGDRTYYRQRYKNGKIMGYVSAAAWAELLAQVRAGRQMRRLERERDRLRKRMDAIAVMAAGMTNNKQG